MGTTVHRETRFGTQNPAVALFRVFLGAGPIKELWAHLRDGTQRIHRHVQAKTMKTSTIGNCMAHHESDGFRAAAAALRVLIAPSIDGGYVAQGIDIDFVASGDSAEAARDHFATAFSETVAAYLRRGKDLAGLFKTQVPAEVRQAYFAQPVGALFICAVSLNGDALPAGTHIPNTLSFLQAERPLAA